jgi:F-type H+-transporting ATPase subunit b
MFLFPYLGTIIWVTIIFLIVFFGLTKFAWKPLLKALDDREKKVEESLNAAKNAEQQLANLENEQQKVISSARQEKEKLLKEGVDLHEKIVASAKEKAQLEADKIIEDTRKQMERERKLAIAEMKTQISELSVEIASKVIRADMQDKKRHEKMVEELIKDVELN